MLHYNIEIIVNYEVLIDSDSALLVRSLQLNSLVNLRHDRLTIVHTHRLEVNELLDEYECLRVLVTRDECFNLR